MYGCRLRGGRPPIGQHKYLLGVSVPRSRDSFGITDTNNTRQSKNKGRVPMEYKEQEQPMPIFRSTQQWLSIRSMPQSRVATRLLFKNIAHESSWITLDHICYDPKRSQIDQLAVLTSWQPHDIAICLHWRCSKSSAMLNIDANNDTAVTHAMNTCNR